MRVETELPMGDLRATSAAARRLERLGYDGLVAREGRHDPYLPLAVAATRTRRVTLATSVAIAFPRSPMVTAMVAWDLQRASGGRFSLGLGTQVRGHNERRFATPWVGPPQQRMRDYIRAVRAAWHTFQTGAALDHRGPYYNLTLMTPNFNPGPLDCGPPKILLAAIGPAMSRLAGELCDGVRVSLFSTPEYIRDAIVPEMRRGAERAGRDPATLEVAGLGFICTGPTTADVERRREETRRRVAYFGSTPRYRGVFEYYEQQELTPRLTEMGEQGRWDEMAALIPDSLLDRFVIAGTYDEIVPRLLERYGGVCTSIDFTIPSDTPADRERLRHIVAALHREERPTDRNG
ncbi:MAG: TIGR03617 family F420-dependent LLM class oxidoreductase [Dehalococcoidia bacterium]